MGPYLNRYHYYFKRVLKVHKDNFINSILDLLLLVSLFVGKFLENMMKKFENLGLSKDIVENLEKLGIVKPTEIQEKSIPILLKGNDIIAGSATGSGKTLAFSAPIIENMIPKNGVGALIMTPTRELAEQVTESIKSFSLRKLNVLAVYGGVSIEGQIRKMGHADIVVGTPGRILDHIDRRTIDLRRVKFLVLDEFDRMLDMGFQKDVGEIIKKCPRERQTMLFSATLSADVDHLAKKYTKNAQEIKVEQYVDHSKLKQIYYDTPNELKFSLLVHLLNKEDSKFVMVFCSTRRNVDFVTENLNRLRIQSKAIHGGLDQKKRIRVLNEFNDDGVGVLVCTDVAARGLDIKGVTHVYNYDLPKTPDDYIHRIGRTARAGEKGIAVNILSSRDYEFFGEICNKTNFKIENVRLPLIERVSIRVDKSRNSRGRSVRGNTGAPRGRGSSGGRGNFGRRR